MDAGGYYLWSVTSPSAHVEMLTRSLRRDALRRMRHVHTHNHRRCSLEPRPTVGVQFMVDAAQLHVDLERDVGKVLHLIFLDFAGLHADGGKVELDVAEPLETVVDRLVIVGQHDEDELRVNSLHQTSQRLFYAVDRIVPKNVGSARRQLYVCIGMFPQRLDGHAALDAHRMEPVGSFL